MMKGAPGSDAAEAKTSAHSKDTIKKPSFRFLALKGGGSRGFIHLGVSIALKKMGLLNDIDMVGGSSAGAIAALLIATGWPLEKIYKELADLNLQDLIYKEWSFTAPYRLYANLGLHDGANLYAWFKKIIKEVTGDENATFMDWHEKVVENIRSESEDKMKDIYMEACNIETGFNEEFSHTSSQHAHVPVVDALRASIAYTGFFTPWEIKGVKYNDGGLQSDCPVMLFEKLEGEPNPEMLGVWMDSIDRLEYILHGKPPKSMKVSSIQDLGYSNACAMYNLQLRNLQRSKYKDKLIYCDTLGYETLSFANDHETISRMIQSGIYGTARYFLMNYPEFTKQYFDPIILEQMHKLSYPLSIDQFHKTPIFLDGFGEMTGPPKEEVDHLEDVYVYIPQFKALTISDSMTDTSKPELHDHQESTQDEDVQKSEVAAEVKADEKPLDASQIPAPDKSGWCNLL